MRRIRDDEGETVTKTVSVDAPRSDLESDNALADNDRHEEDFVSKPYFILMMLTFVLIGVKNAAQASRAPTPDRHTETILSLYFAEMKQLLETCGRYPTTAEGLAAVHERPALLECPTQSKDQWHNEVNHGLDGWNEPLQYTSDGKDYRITASHGYFVTNKSPARPNNHTSHWETPNGGSGPLPPFGIDSWGLFFFHLALLSTAVCSFFARIAFSKRIPEESRKTFNQNAITIGIICVLVSLFVFIVTPNT